ncbi:MAG TPA: hypothetical protein VMU77_04100 [Acidimicrobiales bacterium]|nr:hypothetical protein [Acidimicrobiales bacterium]
MQRWDYRVLPWPADIEASSGFGASDYSDSLENLLKDLGRDGFELVQIAERPAALGGSGESYLIFKRIGPSGDAAYRREGLDYTRGNFSELT